MGTFTAYTCLVALVQWAVLLYGQELEPRVMHGNPIKIREMPYVCAIVIDKTYELIGTGTIISENWVLTAAHVLDNHKYDKFNTVVAYGVSIINYQEVGRYAAIEEIFFHKQFKEEHWYFKYDISMVKTIDLRLQRGIAEIKTLAPPGVTHPPGTTCMLGGYGLSAYTRLDKGPARLRMTTLQIISDEECAQYTKLLPGMFCASSTSTGVCNGDSGAGLICDGNLYAFHTRGMNCDPNLPNVGFYIRVDDARPFILQVTNVPKF